MKLKKKPTYPKREMLRIEEDMTAFDTLQEVVDHVLNDGVEPKDVKVSYSYYDSASISYYKPEDMVDFEKRIQAYRLAEIEYNKWYKDNEIAIEEELNARARKNKEKNIRKIEKLRKEMERAQKDLVRAEQKYLDT